MHTPSTMQTRRAACMDARRFPTEPGWRVGKSPRCPIHECAWTFQRHFFGDFPCASKESDPPHAEALHFEAKSQDTGLLAALALWGRPCGTICAPRAGPAFAVMTSKGQGRWIPASRDDGNPV